MSVSYRKSTNIIAAGATLRITRQGSFFHVIEADKAFSVGFNNNGLSPFFAGLEYEVPDGTAFTSVQIENTSSDDLTISFGIGSGGVRDGRLTVTGKLKVEDTDGNSFAQNIAAIDAAATAPDTFTTGAAVSAGNGATSLIAAANASRSEVILVNTDAEKMVYIGGASGATAAQGIPLQAGQSITLQTSAAIYARNDSGGAVAVAVAELGRS